MIDVEWDGEQRRPIFRAGVEVVALDRSRLLRDVANALGDHHVNIVSCETVTGDDRVARMRFGFEIANPGHLDGGAEHDQADRRRLRRLPADPGRRRRATDVERRNRSRHCHVAQR